ncbi:phage tail protein [Rhodococcoides fascians A25f]|uniref:Gp37-like protein n=1 Tax=Rhodococcoides fascians TaxID=1828 RepID=UPI00068ECBFA|nr:hypothetical protein [Rhodococcus fascians]QII04360.1 phage tail protein [Rhodococcus fascians A25f]
MAVDTVGGQVGGVGVADAIDFDLEFQKIADRLAADERNRLKPPLVRLWDGDWNLRGICAQENSASFQLVNNETGIGTIELPEGYYLSDWLVDVESRGTTNVFITVDKDGMRWAGMMEEFELLHDDIGKSVVKVTFKHDYQHLKHILFWSLPWLPAEVQPGSWIGFGTAKQVCKTALLANIMRLESSAFMLPDNPLDASQWFNFNQSTWSMTVKPTQPGEVDNSLIAILVSRFKTGHEACRRIVDDSQLTWVCRRYLEGDPPPWPGANLRHGCLVWDLVDKSGFNTGTAFRGDIFGGLIHEIMTIGSDGITENVETIDDPNVPGELFQPGWRGTVPQLPGCVFYESEQTGTFRTSFKHKPATVVQTVAGGHSAPYVNETIKAFIVMAGNLTASIPGIPPMGEVADAFLSPIYTDAFFAFGAHKSPQRAQRLSTKGFHYFEDMAQGADRAYTLKYLIAQRAAMYESRESTRATLTVTDGNPWRVGEKGFGDFSIGDRVGFTIRGPKSLYGKIFVEQVSELTLAWDRGTTPTWQIKIGSREPEDPILRAFQDLQDFFGMIQALGVV